MGPKHGKLVLPQTSNHEVSPLPPSILRLWQEQIEELPGWQVHRHEGYRAITVDVTAFWRPALQNSPSKHYHPVANRALPAVIFGIIGAVGEVGGQRLACPLAFERVCPNDTCESRLWQDLLRWAKRHLADVQAAGLECYVLRLATNFTAHRNRPLPYGGKGRRPVYGEKIRPLERSYKGKTIAASAPDRVETWTEAGVELRAEIWEELILPGIIPGPQAKTFRVYAIYNPDYTAPWLLATPLNRSGALPGAADPGSRSGRAAIWHPRRRTAPARQGRGAKCNLLAGAASNCINIAAHTTI